MCHVAEFELAREAAALDACCPNHLKAAAKRFAHPRGLFLMSEVPLYQWRRESSLEGVLLAEGVPRYLPPNPALSPGCKSRIFFSSCMHPEHEYGEQMAAAASRGPGEICPT